MPESIQISHEKSTKIEAVDAALLSFALCTVFGLLLVVLYWCREVFAFFMVLLVIGVFVLSLVVSCIRNFRVDGTFRCVLTSDRISCHCPLKDRGDSFNLKLAEITMIEAEFVSSGADDCGGGAKYYLHDKKGNKYWLTNDYDNPVARILDRLEELNPDLQMIRTPPRMEKK